MDEKKIINFEEMPEYKEFINCCQAAGFNGSVDYREKYDSYHVNVKEVFPYKDRIFNDGNAKERLIESMKKYQEEIERIMKR